MSTAEIANLSERIRKQVRDYLLDHIGHLMTPGVPEHDSEKDVWRVAALCRTDRGLLPVGECVLRSDGSFLYQLTREEVRKALEAQRESPCVVVRGTREAAERAGLEVVVG
ncbi:MAG: hypothetical protein HY318_12655 [Armatimonadetes bacterium]|nr:hypothetical protein [Armatimonadota bacterium]